VLITAELKKCTSSSFILERGEIERDREREGVALGTRIPVIEKVKLEASLPVIESIEE